MSGPRFGGRPAAGTPSLALSSVVVVASLLTGASIVHNIFKPDLTIPLVESVNQGEDKTEALAGSKPDKT
uniref:Uncharacterized protein n=1 Tax=Picea sitchensis TaxID=3332 RepID=A9NQT0_PICSI|nr:unknown [Picea sitchensis]